MVKYVYSRIDQIQYSRFMKIFYLATLHEYFQYYIPVRWRCLDLLHYSTLTKIKYTTIFLTFQRIVESSVTCCSRFHFVMNGVKSGNLKPSKSPKLLVENLGCGESALMFLRDAEEKLDEMDVEMEPLRRNPHCAAQTSSRSTASLGHSLRSCWQSVTLRDAQLP